MNNKVKTILGVLLVTAIATPAFAGPHHKHDKRHNEGVHLAAEIIGLVGQALRITTPPPPPPQTVIVTQPAPPPPPVQTVIVTQPAPPPPPVQTVVVTQPAPRPVIVTPPPRPVVRRPAPPPRRPAPARKQGGHHGGHRR